MRRFITPCLLLFTLSAGFSQTPGVDTAFLATSRVYKTALYDKFIGGQSRLYNGTQYRDYLSHNDEHPYYGVDDWVYGFVVYDDEYYDSVALFYDISRDRIITEHLLSGSKIELITTKVSEFSLNNEHFSHLHKDKGGIIDDAFYHVLYNGKTKVYARYIKTLNTRAEGNELVYTFEERTRYFIFKDGAYYPVKTKRSVLDVFGDRRQELKAELNKSNVSFKGNRARAIALMAERYDAPQN